MLCYYLCWFLSEVLNLFLLCCAAPARPSACSSRRSQQSSAALLLKLSGTKQAQQISFLPASNLEPPSVPLARVRFERWCLSLRDSTGRWPDSRGNPKRRVSVFLSLVFFPPPLGWYICVPFSFIAFCSFGYSSTGLLVICKMRRKSLQNRFFRCFPTASSKFVCFFAFFFFSFSSLAWRRWSFLQQIFLPCSVSLVVDVVSLFCSNFKRSKLVEENEPLLSP